MVSAEYLGKTVKLSGWFFLSFLVILWILIPLVRGLINIAKTEEALLVLRDILWGINGEELFKITAAFIVGGLIIKMGNYVGEYEQKKSVETEDKILGYLKLTGRTNIEDLSTKVGISSTQLIKILSIIRQKREFVFFIDGNEVYMPGYERERPKEVVKEIVKEVVKIPCKHCGYLSDPNAEKCPNCSAPIKA